MHTEAKKNVDASGGKRGTEKSTNRLFSTVSIVSCNRSFSYACHAIVDIKTFAELALFSYFIEIENLKAIHFWDLNGSVGECRRRS